MTEQTSLPVSTVTRNILERDFLCCSKTVIYACSTLLNQRHFLSIKMFHSGEHRFPSQGIEGAIQQRNREIENERKGEKNNKNYNRSNKILPIEFSSA